MFESLVRGVFLGLGVYLALGLVFGLAFVLRGIRSVDPAAEGATWGFRVLVLPGSAVFWPLLLARWVRGSGPPEERGPHRVQAPGEVRP